MRRTIVYIDGFNLYHAIDGLGVQSLKWLDLRALSESILRQGETLKSVKYFSAFATWRPDAYARHLDYVRALEARGIEVVLGQFKEKPRKCQSCKSKWMAHEEKETDVNIASHMIADALTGEVERLILVSADTDLSPPIKIIARHAPHCEVFVATPPGRFKICRALMPKLELSRARIAKCFLPARVQIDAGRWVERPVKYDPMVEIAA